MLRLLPTLAIALLLCPLTAQSRPTKGKVPQLVHGTFVEGSFTSRAMGGRTPYGIYLPEGYSDPANADKRYPLVIFLHGMWEDHQRFHIRGGTVILDELIAKGELPEMIFVTAEGGHSSFYINAGPSKGFEDLIVVDLLEHIENEYRVEPGRANRALVGVSMGGYGALKIAIKHPDTFGVVAAHSAALLPRDPEQLDVRFPWLKRWGGAKRVLGQIFGTPIDLDRWNAENVLYLADKLDPDKLGGLKIYLDCGDHDRYGFQEPNQELHDLLTKKKIAHTWRLVKDGDHGWRANYNQAALPHSLEFVASAWAAAKGTSGLGGLLRGSGDLPGKRGSKD